MTSDLYRLVGLALDWLDVRLTRARRFVWQRVAE